MNLCTNAYQAIGGGEGELSISLRSVEVDYATAARYPDLSEGRHALLTVRDTGEGMDALTLSRAYDPFFTTKGTGEGTGLGLAVVHGIVKSHKGSIAVESELGTGTTFLIYLPQVSSDEATETAGRPAPLSGNEHILFVDDEVALAKLGKKMLEQLGYHVTLETVAHRGINTFRAKPEAFDLIITDQTMPGMTGDRLAREAKDIRADIPVMICTGYSDMLNEAKAEEIGVNAFLMKPLERAVLARTVREVLEASTGSCTRR